MQAGYTNVYMVYTSRLCSCPSYSSPIFPLVIFPNTESDEGITMTTRWPHYLVGTNSTHRVYNNYVPPESHTSHSSLAVFIYDSCHSIPLSCVMLYISLREQLVAVSWEVMKAQLLLALCMQQCFSISVNNLVELTCKRFPFMKHAHLKTTTLYIRITSGTHCLKLGGHILEPRGMSIVFDGFPTVCIGMSFTIGNLWNSAFLWRCSLWDIRGT